MDLLRKLILSLRNPNSGSSNPSKSLTIRNVNPISAILIPKLDE